jgi:hypothetical protein
MKLGILLAARHDLEALGLKPTAQGIERYSRSFAFLRVDG